jgi:hypothetical protein
MKSIRYILLAIPMLFMLSSCEDFLNINVDRDAPTHVTLDQALPPIIFFAQQIVFDHALYSGYLSQAMTTSSTNPRNSFAFMGGWDFSNQTRHPMWRRHYFDIGTNNRMLMDRALDEDARNIYLIGRTIRLMSTMLTVDAFGDMPHFTAFYMDINATSTPRYNTQEEIYDWLFEEVEALLARYADPDWVNHPRNPALSEKNDFIYGGDMAKWAAFTKALRARLWLRKLPNWENTPVVAERIISYVDAVLNDPNWEEPRFNFDGGPGLHSAPWGPAGTPINGWESWANRLAISMPTDFFAHALLGTYDNPQAPSGQALDPRANRMMTAPGGTSAPIRYIWSNFGTDGRPMSEYPDMYAGGLGVSNPFTANNGYNALMLHEELLFIKAEAEYWSGDINAAFETTKEAVLHNMRRWTVVGAAGEPLNPTQRMIFDRFWAVRMPGAGQFTIATLMQQKHVAMYLQPEQWTDMRRYNYSSPTNGIMYQTPSSTEGVYVYLIEGIHRGEGTTPNDFLPATFTRTYALRRPANLWVVWTTGESFGVPFAVNSPNAWINRLSPDAETETRYNQGELNRIGAMVGSEVVPDWPRNRLIWQFNNSGKAISSNPAAWR